MRPRTSITGPLVLIGIGVLFLLHQLSPSFDIGGWLAQYWPLILIAWGVAELIEISIRSVFNRPVPRSGVSGGGWFLVVLICLIGLTAYEFHRPDSWWRQIGWVNGVETFGEGHDYSIATQQKSVGNAPHIVIESFRGDAKIVGSDGTDLVVNGHKRIHSFDARRADEANARTPIELLEQGGNWVIRCNQEKADGRTPVTTDLDISLPKGSSIEATGQVGDFDISSIAGNIDVNSENSGVRLQDIGGDVKIETRRSDLIRCTNVSGAVDLRGHGNDVELSKIAGQVTINGNFGGTVSLHDLAKPIRLENFRTELDAEQVPGEIRLDRGSLNVENVIGPLRLTTHATDVSLDGFSNDIELSVDKGDIDLRPGRVPLGKMTVHTRSGNIELALPQSASFALTASTDHGEIDNEFGDALKQRTEGQAAHLEGTIGSGPDLNLTTARGSITVRKASAEATSTKAASDQGRQESNVHTT